MKDQPNISLRKLLKWLKDDHGFTGSLWPVHKFLKENGFVSKIAKKVFAILKVNQQKRIEISQQMLEKPADFFKMVIWSDETSVKSRPDYRQLRYYGRSGKENDRSFVNRQVCAGGFSVMFWGCISYQAMGPLVVIEGKIDQSKYMEIISDNLLPEIAYYNGEIMFQQDHAPPHKAKRTLQFLSEKGVRLFPHPPQSPDLNPIERVWALMKRKLYEDYPIPTSRDQLIDCMFQIWRDFPMETIRNIIDGMPQRYKKVLDSKGLWIE